MIEDPDGLIDYAESGAGSPIVFVPGSCSTGAAWRPVIVALGSGYRCITTSLLGYGATAERRVAGRATIEQEAEVVEAVVRRAGGPVHLVGHSFGGLVSLVVAWRGRVPLHSLTIAEAPALELLQDRNEHEHYRAFSEMTEKYFGAFRAGEREAIALMIDFYGGAGTYASWPARVREYAIQTTAANILDWECAHGHPLTAAGLAEVSIPSLVMWGGESHPAAQRANALLGQYIPGAQSVTIAGAAHFMILSHPGDVAHLIAAHILRAGSPIPAGA